MSREYTVRHSEGFQYLMVKTDEPNWKDGWMPLFKLTAEQETALQQVDKIRSIKEAAVLAHCKTSSLNTGVI
jgi:hypothetical protein